MIRPKDLAFRLANKIGTTVLSPPWGGWPQFVNHGPRTENRVAITFDDGPSVPSTSDLVDVLDDLSAKATFFCVGENTSFHPELVRSMVERGHVVGNHSYRHSRLSGMRFGHDDGHIAEGEEALVAALGRRPLLYRPPWGWLTPWEGRRLHRLGYTIIGWDVYTLDWQIPEPDGRAVALKAAREARPGSILLFHDAFPSKREWNKSQTIEAMRHLVPALRDKGLEPVTVPELLGIEAYGRPRSANASSNTPDHRRS